MLFSAKNEKKLRPLCAREDNQLRGTYLYTQGTVQQVFGKVGRGKDIETAQLSI